ncbi:Remorin like [Actinidia chinensis var. chinensis]|uniref:Remorin like n=1 Tax=Actinidia chinensis var. chinensis TaxID=1590841 RepID=A0A2R6P3F2_ACTCC|nr:Remorin like [Actinidia chinensis var. chinensis]
MRSIEDKGCLNYGQAQESSGNSASNFEFHKGNGTNRASHHRTALGKPTPSKWDDAQKWLVNLSRGGGERNESKTKPRNSNADDRRLIAAVPKKEDYSSGEEEREENGFPNSIQYEVETKNVDCEEPVWRINKSSKNPNSVVRSICVRDMGTEMTPIASQEPSRTATPIRATTPATRSPITSGSSTPGRTQQRVQALESSHTGLSSMESRGRDLQESGKGAGNKHSEQAEKPDPLETRAMAWDEAERAKYMARYKREEVKIQAWENHEKRKAEMEMKRMEVKAERLKARAQEKLTNKLAATRRIAEEKLANAEAELNEKAVKTSEHADYIRRTGHLPSSFSFKLPSFCW